MKHSRYQAILYALLLTLFVVMLLVMPPSQGIMNKYHLSAAEFRTFFLMIELPLVLVWLTAFYAYTKIKSYAIKITASPEEKGFNGLAKGCLWLAWGLPVSAITAVLLIIISHHEPKLATAASIFSNYLNLLVAILAFSIMSEGTRHLIKMYDIRPKDNRTRQVLQQLVLILIGIVYCFLILKNYSFAGIRSSNNEYLLPSWFIIVSFIIPYLYAWFMGMLTVADILVLATNTPGILYKRGLASLAAGIIVVIVSLMGVQYLRAGLTHTSASVSTDINTAYFIYALCIVGLSLVISGISNLQKIEEI